MTGVDFSNNYNNFFEIFITYIPLSDQTTILTKCSTYNILITKYKYYKLHLNSGGSHRFS